MKISKNSKIDAGTNTCNIAAKPEILDKTEIDESNDEAKAKIMEAINILSKDAKTKIECRDAIADLSVIYFTL